MQEPGASFQEGANVHGRWTARRVRASEGRGGKLTTAEPRSSTRPLCRARVSEGRSVLGAGSCEHRRKCCGHRGQMAGPTPLQPAQDGDWTLGLRDPPRVRAAAHRPGLSPEPALEQGPLGGPREASGPLFLGGPACSGKADIPEIPASRGAWRVAARRPGSAPPPEGARGRAGGRGRRGAPRASGPGSAPKQRDRKSVV